MRHFISFLVLILVSLPTFAASLEVVQSVPLETSLEVPGIRQTQEVWLEMIDNARSSIDLEEFYIDNRPGQALAPVLASLEKAAARGVKIRFIVDSKFYKNYPQEPDRLGKLPNVQVKVLVMPSGVQHSKYFVVDGANAYVGSANFDWLALDHIHEIGLRVSDDKVASKLEAVFEKDWSGKDVSTTPGANGSLEVIASPPSLNPSGMTETLPELLALMDTAQKSLRVQVYQYSTKDSFGSGKKWAELDNALRRAAKRGARVQLLVDAVALKTGSKDLKALAKVKNIEVRTVTIPQWSGGHLDYARLIHSKYCVVDGAAAWVGSENWTESYFTNSRNVGLITRSKDIAGDLDQIFERVWTSSYAAAL